MSITNVNQSARFFSHMLDKQSESQTDPIPYGLQFKEKMFDGAQPGDDFTVSTGQSPTSIMTGSDTCIDVDPD